MEPNEEIIRQLYHDVMSKRENVSFTGAYSFSPYAVSSELHTLKVFRRFFKTVILAFPDCQLTIENIVAKADKFMVRYAISGTQVNDFMGTAPTNERMNILGIDVFRLDNGRVAEHWDAAYQITAAQPLTGEPMMPERSWGPQTLVNSSAC
jgi:predicted ester cyclase